MKNCSAKFLSALLTVLLLFSSCDLSESDSEMLRSDLQNLKDDVSDFGEELKNVGNELYSSLIDQESSENEDAAAQPALPDIPAPEQSVEMIERFWLEIRSDYNLFFSTYDIDIVLDGEPLATLSNGKTFSEERPLAVGDHELIAYKSGSKSTSDSYRFSVTENSVFTATILHNSSGVEISNAELTLGMDRIEGVMPDVTDILYSDAIDLLKSYGFTNISGHNGDKIIWSETSRSDLVKEQSVTVGTIWKKADEIHLDCISFSDYCETLLSGKTFDEGKTIAESEEIVYSCYDQENKVLLQEPLEHEDGWMINDIVQGRDPGKSVVLYLTYIGTPEERAAEEARLEAERQAQEALLAEQATWEQEQAELLAVLESALPLENAKKAVTIAFTNSEAMDVFTYDGSDYDPSKFHGGSYTGEYAFTVKENGTWTADSTWAWNVENMLLYKRAYDRAIRLSCKVTCDGQNYIVYNVSYVSGALRYVDSGDPSKTSGIVTLEPDDYNPYLTIPVGLLSASIASDLSNNWSTLELNDNTDQWSAGIGSADYGQSWQDATRDSAWQEENQTIYTIEEETVSEQIVYITPYGKRWHTDPDCGGVNSFPVTMTEALRRSRTPCQKCVH